MCTAGYSARDTEKRNEAFLSEVQFWPGNNASNKKGLNLVQTQACAAVMEKIQLPWGIWADAKNIAGQRGGEKALSPHHTTPRLQCSSLKARCLFFPWTLELSHLNSGWLLKNLSPAMNCRCVLVKSTNRCREASIVQWMATRKLL